ncbi:MAG: hypothetical protein EHM78_01985 [Myxococcaceae bacterium]|nr:MAG: hypothetical protein EHM78_01985 [Myxococcaceae bacterium]
MTYVIYHISSTMQVGPTKFGNPATHEAKKYKTLGAALATCRKFNERAIAKDAADIVKYGCTHGDNRTAGVGPGPYGACSIDHYATKVVRTVTRTNLLSGQAYQEASNTPGYCSPSSEAYWAM